MEGDSLSKCLTSRPRAHEAFRECFPSYQEQDEHQVKIRVSRQALEEQSSSRSHIGHPPSYLVDVLSSHDDQMEAPCYEVRMRRKLSRTVGRLT